MSVTANLYCNLPAWTNQSYSVRNCVSSGGNAYRCTTAGTAPTAPSGMLTTPVSFGTGLSAGTSKWVWLSAITFSGSTADAVFAAAEAGSTASGGLSGSITQPIVWQCWWTNDATWQISAAGTPLLTLIGHAFTPTNNFTLRWAPGESIRDAGSGTPGAFNAAKGGSWTLPSGTGNQNYISVFDPNVTFDGLQIQDPNATSGSTILKLNAGANNFHFRGGILDGFSQAGGAIMVDFASGTPAALTGILFVNSLVVNRQPTNSNNYTIKDSSPSASNGTFVNCTFISTNPQNSTWAVTSNSITTNSWTVRNCISIGFANGILAASSLGGGISVIDHCGTDANQIANAFGIGTDSGGELVSQTVANMFVSSTSDFRLKSGSPFLNNGVTDATNIPAQDDLFRTSRPQGAAWDRGAFELPLTLSLAPANGSIVFTGQAPTVSILPGTAWNPSDKDAGITLSAGNTIATTNVASQTGVRSVTSNSTGKLYAEFTVESVPANGFECGIAAASWSFNTALGANTASLGIGIFAGDVKLNGVLLGNIGGGATIGSVISIAWNITNELIWIRLNNGHYNSSGTANPDTGVGGWTTSALVAFQTTSSVLTPTSGGSLTDNQGRIWTLNVFGGMELNGVPIIPSPGMDLATIYQGILYARDSYSQIWTNWDGASFIGEYTIIPPLTSLSTPISYFCAMGGINTIGASLSFNGSPPFTEAPPSTFTAWDGGVTTGIFPSAGSIVVTGYAPSVNFGLSPSVGSIVLTGFAPELVSSLFPGVGVGGGIGYFEIGVSSIGGNASILFSGLSPVITGGATAFTPDVDSIIFTGFNPDVSGAALEGLAPLTPDAASLTFTGFAPSADQAAPSFFAPDSGSIFLIGAPPTITGQSIWTEIDAAKEGIWTLYATGPSAPIWQTQV